MDDLEKCNLWCYECNTIIVKAGKECEDRYFHDPGVLYDYEREEAARRTRADDVCGPVVPLNSVSWNILTISPCAEN